MINKKLVSSRFSKNLANYDDNARVQKRMAEHLFSFVKNKNVKKILEIGCGTGFLTKFICTHCRYESFTTIDIVNECQEYIEQINTNINFIGTDIEDYLKNNNETFDLIISNAALQWIEDFEEVIKSLKKRLNTNGELIFSTFGKENFREFYQILGTSLKYYSIAELKEMFKDFEFQIDEEIQILAFSDPIDVLKHLQLTGVNAIEHKSWTKKDLLKFKNAYLNICSKRPTLTYNPIYIKIF